METEQQKEIIQLFPLRIKVVSKKTGFPGIGEIVGIIQPELFIHFNRNSIDYNDENNTWNRVYKDWKCKPVYYVYFNEMRKPITWQEALLSSKNLDMSEYEIKEIYNNIPETNLIAYPHDDLELWESE